MALKSEPTGFDYWEVLPGQGHYYNPEFRTASGNVRREGYVTDVIADRALEWLERSGTTKPFMLMFQQKLAAPQLDARARALDAAPTAHRLVPVNLFRRLREPRLPARKQEMEIDRHMNFGADLKIRPPEGSNESRAYEANIGRMTPDKRKMWDAIYEPKNAA
ncbi:MAG: hypothetical protein R2748_19720 [Bryobacterales bacterium]